MNRIVKKSLVTILATSFFALLLAPSPGQADPSTANQYKSKVGELDRKIDSLDKASQQTRRVYAKTVAEYQKKHRKLAAAIQAVANSHKKKRAWANITKIKKLAKNLRNAGEQFELTAKSQLRKLFHIERNRTQRLHQRADLAMAWSIAFLKQRIDKFRKEMQRIEEASIAQQISRMMLERDNLMRKRITIQDLFNKNMKLLSLRETAALKHFSPNQPE